MGQRVLCSSPQTVLGWPASLRTTKLCLRKLLFVAGWCPTHCGVLNKDSAQLYTVGDPQDKAWRVWIVANLADFCSVTSAFIVVTSLITILNGNLVFNALNCLQ